MGDEVLTEVRGRVLVIELNRPEARNAINTALAEGLVAAVRRLDDDPMLTVGVLTGRGGFFCAGMDLKAFATEGTPKAIDEFLWNGARKPLVAAVERYALAGGLELALSCDLLVAGSDAKFGVPEVRRGLLAAGGALFRLPRRVPYGVALELALTGDTVTAAEAHAYGLVTRVADPGRALDVALELADAIAANAPLAVAASKQLLRAVQGRTEEEFIEFQRPVVAGVFRSDDAKEGAAAFVEKRPPRWTGK
jgi:enoyl-CoA hydratase